MQGKVETGKTIQLMTGATCDLPKDWLQANNIIEFPFYINFGGDLKDSKRTDDPKLTLAGVFQIAQTSDKEHFPQTAAPSPDLINACLAGKEGTILPIVAGDEISRAIYSVEEVRNHPENPNINILESINTRNTSLGEGFIVRIVQNAILKGYNEEQIRNLVNIAIPLTNMFSKPGDLFYAWKGGRIGGVQARLGSALKLKGIAHAYDNHIQIIPQKFRTDGQVTKYFLDFLADHGPITYLGVLHTGDNEADARRLLDAARNKINVKDDHVIFSRAGLASGVHNGPRSLGFGIVQEIEEP